MSVNANYRGMPYLRAGISACSVALLVSICFLAATPQTRAADDSSKPSATPGQKIFVPPARQVVLDDLRQATPAQLAAHPATLRPRDGLTDKQRRELKLEIEHRAAHGSASPGSAPSKVKPPAAGAFVSVPGLNQEFACPGCTPSDMALAVSENFVVQIVNSAVNVYDKRGNAQSGYPKSINDFFSLPANAFTTDPRAFYDWENHRFLIVMLLESDLHQSDNVGSLLIAASQTHDPRLGWWTYNPAFQIGNTGECPDYPTLGHDSTNWGSGGTKGGFYVGINQFDTPCASLIQNYMFLIPKDAVYSGGGFGAPTWSGFTDGPLVDTIQAANITGRGDKLGAVLMVNSFNINFGGGQCRNGCNGLILWTITNPFASGSLSATVIGTVNNYSLPPNAHEPGCTTFGCIETIDTRITGQVKYNAGSLWGSLDTDGSGGGAVGSHTLWFEVRPQTDANSNLTGATELQEDCFFCGGQGTNGSSFFGTIGADPEGNATLVYNFSDDSSYPGTAYTSRRVDYCCLMNGAGLWPLTTRRFRSWTRRSAVCSTRLLVS